MKNFFRFAILSILAVGLIASLLVSCGAAKPNTIKLMVDGTWLQPDNGESIIEEAYEELSGVDLVINHPPHNDYYQRLDLAFSTGEYPDVFVLGAGQYVKFASNGALYDVTEMYEKSKMKANMRTQAYVESLRIDGKLYGIPTARGNGTLTYVRMDWLEKLNMQPPADYAAFLTMLRAFKANNPDGLSPDKVIPITSAGLANVEFPMDIYFREFYQDATPDYLEKNGKWVDGMLEPNFKAALTRMREAYAEGLIDTEIVTNQTSTCRNKFFSGVVGAFNYWAGYWNDRLIDGIIKNVPHAKVRGIPAIKETYYVERPTGCMAMYAGAENPQGIFDNWFELLNDNGPGQMLFCFGVEGKTYKINADGKIDFLPQIIDPKAKYSKAFVDPSGVVTIFAPDFVRLPFIGPSYEIFNKYAKQYPLPSISEVYGTNQKEISLIKRNLISKIVFGDLTVDEGIAQYKKEIQKYNDVVLPDMNK